MRATVSFAKSTLATSTVRCDKKKFDVEKQGQGQLYIPLYLTDLRRSGGIEFLYTVSLLQFFYILCVANMYNRNKNVLMLNINI